MNPSERITNHINELADWRGKVLARLRKLILMPPQESSKNGNGTPPCGRTTKMLLRLELSRIMSRSTFSRVHRWTIRMVSSTPALKPRQPAPLISTKAMSSMRLC